MSLYDIREINQIAGILLALSLFMLMLLHIFRTNKGRIVFWVNMAIYALYGIFFPLFLISTWNSSKTEAGLAGAAFIAIICVVIPVIHFGALTLYSLIAHYWQLKKGIIKPRPIGFGKYVTRFFFALSAICGLTLIITEGFIRPELEEKRRKKSKKEWLKKEQNRKIRDTNRPNYKRHYDVVNYREKLFSKNDTATNNDYLDNKVKMSSLKRGGVLYYLGKDPYSGVATEYDAEGSLQTERRFYKGLEHGKQEVFADERGGKDIRIFHYGQILKREHWYGNGQKQFIHLYNKEGKQHGLWEEWHSNGNKAMETNYVNSTPDGKMKLWHRNGNQHSITGYKMGAPHGPTKQWHSNGQMKAEMFYKDGEKVGEWTYWDENGKVIKTENWN